MNCKIQLFKNHLEYNSKKIKKILIFYQGLDNLAFIQKIIKEKNFDHCTIITTGSTDKIYSKKIKKNKKINIYHIDSKLNFLNILKLSYKLKFENNFEKKGNSVYDTAYYFSDYEDFITSYYLSKLKIKKIYLLKPRLEEQNKFLKNKKGITLKNFIKISIIKFLISDALIKTNFIKLSFGDRLVLKFTIRNKRIQNLTINIDQDLLKLLPNAVRNKYKNKKIIIFIDSLEYEKLNEEYLILIEKIYNICKQLNLELYYKPHYSKKFEIKNLNNKIKIIYDKDPIHLFDFDKKCLICGLGSIALAHITKTNTKCNVISFIDILNKKQRKLFYNYKSYLIARQNKGNKIVFLKNFDQFKTFLKNKNF